MWVVTVTLCNNAYWIFELRQCNQRAEIKQLMCDIEVCIAKAQDNAEMGWHAYEIKLGTSTVSFSTAYCKFDFLYTVRGKILEGENFGELMSLKSLARKKLANLLVVY